MKGRYIIMSKNFVRIPIAVTLEGSVLIELQDGESLETLDAEELETRALEAFDDDYDAFYERAEITDVEANGYAARYDDDDYDYDGD